MSSLPVKVIGNSKLASSGVVSLGITSTCDSPMMCILELVGGFNCGHGVCLGLEKRLMSPQRGSKTLDLSESFE